MEIPRNKTTGLNARKETTHPLKYTCAIELHRNAIVNKLETAKEGQNIKLESCEGNQRSLQKKKNDSRNVRNCATKKQGRQSQQINKVPLFEKELTKSSSYGLLDITSPPTNKKKAIRNRNRTP